MLLEDKYNPSLHPWSYGLCYYRVVLLSLNNKQPVLAQPLYPQRAAVMIDGGYWDNILKSMGNPEIDIVRLSEDLCNPAYRVRTYYFDGSTEERQPFFDQLQLNDRFEVILGDVTKREIKCMHCNKNTVIYGQKRVDMLLAVTLVRLVSTKQVDLVVLLAGDRDFLPVVNVAKNEGVIIKLAYTRYPKANVASGLFQKADERIHLNKVFLKKYITKKKKIEKKEQAVITESKKEEDLEDKSSQKLVEELAKVMKGYRKTRYSAGAFGDHLKQIRFPISVKMSKLEKLTKGRIIVIKENSGLYLDIEKNEKEKLLPNFDPTKDPAVEFLVTTLKELLKEKNKDFIVHHELASIIHQKESEWKRKYGFLGKHAFTNLLEWAKSCILIKNVKGEKRIGIKT